MNYQLPTQLASGSQKRKRNELEENQIKIVKMAKLTNPSLESSVKQTYQPPNFNQKTPVKATQHNTQKTTSSGISDFSKNVLSKYINMEPPNPTLTQSIITKAPNLTNSSSKSISSLSKENKKSDFELTSLTPLSELYQSNINFSGLKIIEKASTSARSGTSISSKGPIIKKKSSKKLREESDQQTKLPFKRSKSSKHVLKPTVSKDFDSTTNPKDSRVSTKTSGLKSIFNFDYFNDIQSACYPIIWKTNNNMIISAPTGSGKTVLFELAICKLFSLEDFTEITSSLKVIYIAPIKTLCQQKFSEWQEKFTKFNLKLLELTGDTEINDFAQFDSANIIITTPEKWDATTRRWKDNNRLVLNVKLLLIDEVHLLNTEERGATLEAAVTRMKLISKSDEMKGTPCAGLRIIAVSATIPNIHDLAEWLEVSEDCIKSFGDEFRSTPIEKHVFGYNMQKNEFQFERSLNYRLVEIIRKFSSGKPTLVFCQTQKGTISACEQILIDLNVKELIKNEAHFQRLVESSHSISDKNLQRFVCHGIGFHNAGMTYEDRKLIEELFIEGYISVICTTSTLAMGVNLPARLVIIKSTLCYRGAGIGYTEYSPLEIEQMMGRAGRPQFDTHGVVVIMTDKKNVEKYRKQYIEKEDLESHFFDQIAEHINAEISLKSIRSVDASVSYLKSTFFFVRMKKNPFKYGLTSGNPKIVEEHLMGLAKNIIKELAQYEMIYYNSMDGKVKPLDLGSDMSKYYVSFSTMKTFFEKHEHQDYKDLILTLSEAQEFEKFRSRLEERKLLSMLNTQIRYPLTGAISTSSKKAYVLVQSALGNLSFDDWELKRQTADILNTSWRILHCFKRFYSIRKLGKGLSNCIKLIKFISMRTWGDNKLTILKQLPGIGDKFASSLCQAGLDNFDKLLQTPPNAIEKACNKNAPFGVQLQKKILMIPRVSLELESFQNLEIKLKVQLYTPKCYVVSNQGYEERSNYYLLVKDKINRIIFSRYLQIDQELKGGLFFTVKNSSNASFPVEAVLINEKYVGIDCKLCIYQDGTILSFDKESVEESPFKNQQSNGKQKSEKCEHSKILSIIKFISRM